jgi:RHS repeat-associated protein
VRRRETWRDVAEAPPSGYWFTGSGTLYDYDAVGNRVDQGGDYGSGNRIRQFAGCTYVTDSLGDGNVLSRTCGSEVVRFWWTAESRLAAVKAGPDSLDFHYDASGRLVRKDLNGAAQAYFLWQGDNLLAELNSTATGKVAEYSYYPGLDNLHAVITGTTPYYAHTDGMGNVIALTDSATQSVQRSYSYDAWGQLVGGTDTLPFTNTDRARFKGALWLGPEVDIAYMRARWYESKSGRFLSEDPIGLDGGINPYSFAGNDPINGRDPTGLIDPIDVWGEPWPTGCDPELSHDPACEIQRAQCQGQWVAALATCYEHGDSRSERDQRDGSDASIQQDGSSPDQDRGSACKRQLIQAAFAMAADVLKVSIFKGIARLARSGSYARGAAYAVANGMPSVGTHFAGRAGALAATGGAQLALGSVYTGSQLAEAWYDDAPLWYKAAKFVPVLGASMEIGEAINVCLLN